jgi:D-aminopeptidase
MTGSHWIDEAGGRAVQSPMVERLASYDMDPLFEATAEAVEEAVVNAMIGAETMTGADYQRRYAIPHDQVQAILRKHGLLMSTTSGG